jgi:hypothetical protein
MTEKNLFVLRKISTAHFCSSFVMANERLRFYSCFSFIATLQGMRFLARVRGSLSYGSYKVEMYC